ncbi:DUF362 domain-containing protein [Chloroflexota bacterium]
MTEPIIYLAKTEDRIAFVNCIMEKFRADFTEPQKSKVLVKPNIVSREQYPTTTHPLVLASVLDFLLNCGNQVVVADGPAIDAGDSDRIILSHPLADVCRHRGIELRNLHKHGFKKVKAQSMSLEISTLAFDCEYIISLPVLKSHKHCYITGALKNQFGFLRNRERIMMHTKLKNLNKGIAEVNSVVKSNLFIIDAIETYEHANERRHGGTGVRLGYMLAGEDPVAMDSLGLELLKRNETISSDVQLENVVYIAHAFRLGLGNIEYKVELVSKEGLTQVEKQRG